ncbi:lytic murein transglycosylase [Pseudomaricurvus alcaniphilus]|nr:lytic murein transglycosylase [Pseudomaricurvus alcaniphilus]
MVLREVVSFLNRWCFFSKSLAVAWLALAVVPTTARADEFADCVANLQQQALASGVPQATVEGPLAQVQFVPKVIELDRRQPEFTQTFAGYFNGRVTDWRVNRGRELLQQHRPLLNRLVVEYGVPAQYLVAFWGLETNYGGYLGKMPILDSLATLACDPRRKTFFTAELFQALHLLSEPGIKPPLFGSWAGAMGHTQFMPSAYRRYARDGDGDGAADLWGSIPDALTSAANFLQQLGWQRGLRWGREVILPPNFDYATAGRGNKQPLTHWRELGLRMVNGERVPASEIEAAVLVPAGFEGPAFLVYDNFAVIMRWNRSEFYALSVGHLADRINGAGTLQVPAPETQPRLSILQVQELQEKLNQLGFEAGTADGILGPGTRQAIRDFQKAHNMVADGYPGETVFKALNISLP